MQRKKDLQGVSFRVRKHSFAMILRNHELDSIFFPSRQSPATPIYIGSAIPGLKIVTTSAPLGR